MECEGELSFFNDIVQSPSELSTCDVRYLITKEEHMELVLPQNYLEIEQEEMEYLDGGWRVTVNRTTINKALSFVGKGWTAIKGLNKLPREQLAKCFISNSLALAKGILAKENLGSWAVALLGFALAGTLVAVAGTLAIVYATNNSFTIGF